MSSPFAARTSVEAFEEGMLLAPKFDAHGLLAVVTTDADNGEVLMHAYMNEAALLKTLETGEAHYYSRSRHQLWHKGATSGLVQKPCSNCWMKGLSFILVQTLIFRMG